VRAVPFVLPDPSAGREALAAALLAPFESEISRADEVLLAPQGVVRSIDIHGLPHAGSTLVARLPVRYVLDVHEAPHAPDEEGAPAVVIADPTADLASARAEGLDVLAALTASARWPVLGWSGLDATAARLATELPRAALLHFAGHGVYAGREGWDSALPLARGARWSVGDVLASRRAPTRVVLSACEGARSSFEAAEGLGLAQAFLVAGAQSVIAPTRAVKDELAQAFARAFYASLLRPGARDGTPATALREAQIAIAAAQPDADWAAFRALSP
jgi:CHAT domain-containing protein